VSYCFASLVFVCLFVIMFVSFNGKTVVTGVMKVLHQTSSGSSNMPLNVSLAAPCSGTQGVNWDAGSPHMGLGDFQVT